MKADLRISVKDFHRNKNLKILLYRADFTHRQFFVRMNGAPWPADGPVSLTTLLTGILKALVKSAGPTPASHPSDQTNRLLNPLK